MPDQLQHHLTDARVWLVEVMRQLCLTARGEAHARRLAAARASVIPRTPDALPYTEEWDPDFDPRQGLLLLRPDGTVPTEDDED